MRETYDKFRWQQGVGAVGPTPTHLASLEVANADFEAVRVRVNTLRQTTIPAFEAALIDAGAP